MDLRVIERACAEQGGHYNDKAIGGVGNRVAAAGEGLTVDGVGPAAVGRRGRGTHQCAGKVVAREEAAG